MIASWMKRLCRGVRPSELRAAGPPPPAEISLEWEEVGWKRPRGNRLREMVEVAVVAGQRHLQEDSWVSAAKGLSKARGTQVLVAEALLSMVLAAG